ncbi:XRE family transcriptional regulator [Lapillicoccus sp.]|uniref:XRE family transcriptional regulator n=1 Tax=Lapillicoccus sp. TaxID=1909287 RepID=UPI0025FBD510|nr:XRE family transcriptional regulator [Lapillicoccus sp.]
MSTPVDRVRLVIAQSGQSQGEFAVGVGLDATKMSKSLAGSRRFSSLDLARIAEHAGVTVDWLLTGEETAVALAARAAVGSSAQVAIAEAGRLIGLRESAARLGYPQPWQPIDLPRRHGRAVDQGAALAQQALAVMESAWRDPAEPDLAQAIESTFGIDVCITSLGKGFDGLAASTTEAKLIVVALTPTAFRQRFTMAHELGHLLAGDDQGIHPDIDIDSPAGRKDPTEIRANAFASCLLMPEEFLRGNVARGFDDTAFAALSLRLMVSPSALAYRLETLRLIDAMTRDRWLRMSASAAARLSGDIAALGAASDYATTARRPGLLSRDLFAAYVDQRTTLRLYASLLGVDSAILRRELERSDEIGG